MITFRNFIASKHTRVVNKYSTSHFSTSITTMAPKVIVGMMGSSVAKGSSNMSTPEQVKDFLSVVKSHGVKELDTALVYNDGKSEELLASVDAQKDFLVSTKAPGFAPGSLTEANILSNSAKSHKNLRQDQVDIYYIHGPDKATPLQEQCQAFGKLYQQGRYQRFGVCNLSPSQIEEIHEICRREGFPPPSIYQGSYNAVHRSPESDLFPTLRKLGMAFYAWGPLAGGLLVKELDDVLKPKPGSRYHEMPVFGNLYLNDHTIAALRKMHTICDENSVSMMEAALRWLMNHSPLSDNDGIILGASSKEQVDATLSACEKGPLPKVVVDGWQELWESIVASGKALPAFFS